MNDLYQLRVEVRKLSNAAIGAAGEGALGNEQSRQILAGFAFGMLFAFGRLEQLNAAQIHALAIAMLQDSFKYNPGASTLFADDLIRAASDKTHHPALNAIIHVGIDGHQLWRQRQQLDFETLVKSTRERFTNEAS